MEKRFIGKTAVITGATSGMGRAVAKAFAEEGADVAVVGRNEERARDVTDFINNSGSGSAKYFLCDVSSYDAVQCLHEEITASYSHIDILYNGMGIYKTYTLEELDMDWWDQTFKTNVNATMYMTKCFIDDLVKTKGCIITTASISGMELYTKGRKNYMYAPSKAALVKFCKLVALNYAKDVRVNVICPGIVQTEIFENPDLSRFDGLIPIGRVAQPEDITGLVKFLASKDAAYITGAVIPIDGAMSLL